MMKQKKSKNSLIRIYGIMLLCLALLFQTHCDAVTAENVQLLLDQNYFPALKEYFHNARKSIKVIMFEASYYTRYRKSQSNQLIEELIAAQKRGVTVEVLLDLRENHDRTTLRNLETAHILKAGGVNVMLDEKSVTTHAKVVLIDDTMAVIGSTNWTNNALTKNHEVSVLIRSQQTVKELADYFLMLQKSGHKY